MKKFGIMAAAALGVSIATSAFAADQIIGVSWSNFQEERWKTDEAAMKAAIEANGDTYISADAQNSAAKQLSDVESLIAQGANALVILSVDSGSVGAAVDAAAAEDIPVIGYDRLIEDDRAFYLTFDNKEVGRVIARSILAVVPEGNYAIIKGDKGDPNALFLLEGMMDVIGDDVASGKITIVGEAFTDGWKPDNAQKNMEQILTANNNDVDAVLSEKRRHGWWGNCCFGRTGHEHSCFWPGRRSCSTEPCCPGHPEYIGLERCAPTGHGGWQHRVGACWWCCIGFH